MKILAGSQSGSLSLSPDGMSVTEHTLWMTELTPDSRSGLIKSSAADALQIRTVSLGRFRGRLGALPTSVVDEIASSIALCVRAPKR